jgi:hypothetical protein
MQISLVRIQALEIMIIPNNEEVKDEREVHNEELHNFPLHQIFEIKEAVIGRA